MKPTKSDCGIVEPCKCFKCMQPKFKFGGFVIGPISGFPALLTSSESRMTRKQIERIDTINDHCKGRPILPPESIKFEFIESNPSDEEFKKYMDEQNKAIAKNFG